MTLKPFLFFTLTLFSLKLWAHSEPSLHFLDVRGDRHQVSAMESQDQDEEPMFPPIHYMQVEKSGHVVVSFRVAHCRGIVHNSLFGIQTRLEEGRLYLAFAIDTQGVRRGRGVRSECEVNEQEQRLSKLTFIQSQNKEPLRNLVRQAEEIIVVNEVNPNSMVKMFSQVTP